MYRHQPHPATPISDAAFLIKRGKKRGGYNCGRCGLPKKGHNCNFPKDITETHTPISTPAPPAAAAAAVAEDSVVSVSSLSVSEWEARRPLPPHGSRRALSFDDDVKEADWREEVELECYEEELDLDPDLPGKLPKSCLWEVFRRLPPVGLLSAAMVCKGWREITKKLWRAAEELRLRVPAKAQIGFFASMLQKCSGLTRLSLTMESDVDATMLACIAFSCPDLQSLEIIISGASVNRITGDELSRFISEKRCLTSLKMEGCGSLGGLIFSSTSLSTLWLSDVHSVSKMAFNCPNLREVSLDFSRQENDSTDLITIVNGLGISCPKLQNIHIASMQLSHAVVLALTAANLRGLRMLSLVLGSEITDASVAAIASSYSKLELLDLSGSSISDSGIGMICNEFPETLTKLLLALCPNITSSGIQFAAAQLPRLELMDCGMTICDPDSELSNEEDISCDLQRTPNGKPHLIYQKLIIKHSRLKKLSLWGCSGLDALYLNCPQLIDLNLNSCRNLHPERLLLQCHNLESVHASDCQNMLVKTIQKQVYDQIPVVENHSPSKRLPDGSKRICVPYLFSPQEFDEEKKWSRPRKRHCAVISTS